MTKEEIARAKELDLLTYFKLVEPGNDNAGRTRTQDIIAHLAGSGKAVENRPPPVGKDYNDTLVQYMQEYRAHCISIDDILEETR